MPPGCTLFAIKPYHIAVCHQVAPSDPSFHLAANRYFNIALILHYQKFQTSDPSMKIANRALSSLSLLLVASNGKCFITTVVVSTSLIEELNRQQGARRCCIQRVVQFALVIKVSRPQYLRPAQNIVLGCFCFMGFLQFIR